MEYTLKFNFTTLKVGRGGSIKGGNGGGECDITTDYSLDVLKTKTDDLKSIAYGSLVDNLKVKKMGLIQSIDIVDVVAR
jgi:hypothetical protein